MAKTEPFDKYMARYDQWFDRNNLIYLAELDAIKSLMPQEGKGLEIGVGTGRFCAPLGIRWGLEPSKQMLRISRQRGIHVVEGVAEKLPFADAQFDFALMVTTICFLDDTEASVQEAWRIIKPSGCFIVGFINRSSPLGKQYQKNRNSSEFYKIATFYSVDEILSLMKRAGFKDFEFAQTIFRSRDAIQEVEPVEEGYGRGAFVVIRGKK